MHKIYGQTGKICQPGYLRAGDIESLVWGEIEDFVFSPDVVVEELRVRLLEQFEGAGEVQKQLESLHSQKMVLEDERAVLLRYFRRRTLSEADMERQLRELADEEKALGEGIENSNATRASDATSALAAVEAYLGRLRAKLDAEIADAGEVSWNTKRRVVEALVADIEVESEFDPQRKREQRAATLHISYRFEDPEMEKARTGKSPKVVAGLSLSRSRRVVAKVEARKDERVEWVKAAIEEGKKNGVELRIEDVIGKIKREKGIVLSRAGVCRMRTQLGLAPDSLQSRAGKAGGVAKRTKAVLI